MVTAEAKLRPVLRALCIAFAIGQTWVSRTFIDPDGTAYADIAKAWLRIDWHNALNSYWSPLYSWLLAVGYAFFGQGIRVQAYLPHIISLAAFFAILAAWEWLMREWERWQGPPMHRNLMDLVSYLTIAWVGLQLNGIAFTSADIILTAILIAIAALLLRIRRG